MAIKDRVWLTYKNNLNPNKLLEVRHESQKPNKRKAWGDEV
ncbi:MAG TPA: hypothetical protein PKD51_16785 [Saprospiraceae bacterium]|nr:hypothetical protein [Saprospiraceae bacterium]